MSGATGIDGQAMVDRRLEPGEGVAIELDEGHRLRVVDLDGQQVTNLVCFNRDDLQEFLETAFSYSQIRTKDQALSLYSDRGNPMLEVSDDTVGVHTLNGDLCTAGELRKRFDVADGPNCHDALDDALSGYDVPDWIPFPASLFRRVDESRNEYELRPAASGPGDYLDGRAEMDLLVGLCVCPNRWDVRNGFSPSPVHVTAYRASGGDGD